MSKRRNHWLIYAAIHTVLCVTAAAADLAELEQAAVRAAVRRAAPAVVQIRTMGGLDQVGRVMIGTGPTTGLIVSQDGFIVSSAFNFAQRPSSILVTLPNGTRVAAQLIATDHSRMLVLLKIETDERLSTLDAVPEDKIVVGQRAIALGRAFDGTDPNVSVGIVSAVGRMLGKVIQTDAKISPNNYGGPLVDIYGRGLGVLVPLSPQEGSDVAGVEWYDAGIGFAVPLSHIDRVLPRLQAGEDLHRGMMGITLTKGDPYTTAAKISAVRTKSPAYEAGLEADDVIVDLDGFPIATKMQLRLALGPRYAGEVVRVAVRRGEEEIARDVELVGQLEPFQHAMLGVLPTRTATDETEHKGVAVRYVYPGSGADAAGIQPGDVILTLEGQEIHSAADAREVLSTIGPGSELAVTLQRKDELVEAVVTTGPLPTDVPSTLPPARTSHDESEASETKAGLSDLQLPEFKNKATVYLPASYHAAVPHGVVMVLHAAGQKDVKGFVRPWQEHCDRHDLILVAPRATDAAAAAWQATDVEYLSKVLAAVMGKYSVDRSRIVVHGHQAGGAMAYRLALSNRETVRGVAVVDAPLPRLRRAPANNPTERVAFYSARATKSRFARRIDRGVKQLRDARFPVTTRDLGDEVRYLNADELSELVRWIDTLDRI